MNYAAKKGQTEVVDSVMRHPLLRIILLYLFAGGPAAGIFIDWTIAVRVTPVGIFKVRRLVDYKVNYKLVLNDPSVPVSDGDSKIRVQDGSASKRKHQEEEEEYDY